eukprot:tig00000217_g19178.t1
MAFTFAARPAFFGNAVAPAKTVAACPVNVAVRAEKEEAPSKSLVSPVVFAGKLQGAEGRTIRLSVTYPKLGGATASFPIKANYSKLVQYSEWTKEYMRIVKAGGRVTGVEVVSKEL